MKRIKKIVVSITALTVFLAAAVIIYNLYGPLNKGSALPDEKTVLSYSQDEPSCSIADAYPESIPEYAGVDVIELNGNKPMFTAYDITHITGETYSDLDGLGRCGSAYALIDESMMPDTERGEIGEIKPSGYRQAKYPGIIDSEPPFLYNRCHLIAYALTGHNADPLDLITGTRHMNVDLMLPYELIVIRNLENYGGHVLYRVSPLFKDNELVARGVELEAYSVEDSGTEVSFHVFIYNVQPGIEIDYLTGLSKASN